MCGFLIFMNFHTVLTYLWRSVWRSEAYSLVGYLLCFSILHVLVTAELGIVCTFAGLRHGSYHWQWRSFWVGAASTVYVGLYLFYYQIMHLDMKLFSDDVKYLLWSLLFLVSYMLFTGTTSSLASTLFINLIY